MSVLGYRIELPNAIRDGAGKWTKDVVLDEMDGEDEDALVDATREQGGKGTFKVSAAERVTRILSHCTLRVGGTERPQGRDRETDPGFFADIWHKAFSSDRQFTMVRLRQATLGDLYKFDRNCPKCGREIKNIATDLSTHTVQAQELMKVACDYHELTLPRSGDKIRWRFFEAKDEDYVGNAQAEFPSEYISVILYERLVAVCKAGTHEWVKPPGGLLYMKKMKGLDRRTFGAVVDAAEGGIDTSITVTCDNSQCRQEMTFKINTSGGDFFFPSVTPSFGSTTNAGSPNVGVGLQTSSIESDSANANE